MQDQAHTTEFEQDMMDAQWHRQHCGEMQTSMLDLHEMDTGLLACMDHFD